MSEIAFDDIRHEIVSRNLQVKALIQDINNCCGPLEMLNEFNNEGRAKLSDLRKQIDRLECVAKEQAKISEKNILLCEVESHREQLTSTLTAFRKANVGCLLRIEKSNKEELFDEANGETSLRHRQQRDKESLVKSSSDVTDRLLSIGRQLAETTKRSADTLDTLSNSSNTMFGTGQELQTTGSTITQSGKLLDKYGRREFTDKVLVFFAFAFFLACVMYIVQKRLF